MYTPTLGEINTAITSKNRKEAATMLQKLIKDKPSADAWFLAAKLTKERHKKVQYLRTALVLNPKHRKSLEYLGQIGEQTTGVHGVLVTGLMHTWQDQVNKSPLLRNLSPRVRMAVGIGIFLTMVITVGLILSTALSMRGPNVSSQGPTEPAIEYFTAASVVDYFDASSLDIMFINQEQDASIGKNIINLDIRDAGNRSRTVTILVYDSVASILSDQDTLAI